jgi:Response regulator containing CheY-like receiver, AAA-type ATPase, and DNA-binding domains
MTRGDLVQEQVKQILCLEDHEDTRDLLDALLTLAGMKISSVASVEEALQQAKTEKFSLYLVDNYLPESSGVDFCKLLRQFDQTTPVVFFSAVAQPAEIQKALDAGAQAYLVKPTDFDNLEPTLLKYLHKPIE